MKLVGPEFQNSQQLAGAFQARFRTMNEKARLIDHPTHPRMEVREAKMGPTVSLGLGK
jgi:hypothetical protein